jgi:hypothetical protein
MGLWTFLAIFFVLVFTSETIKHYLKSKSEIGASAEELEELRIEMNRIKSRVENLEAIAVNEDRDQPKVKWTDFTVEEENEQSSQTKSRVKE